mgnify:CR=1 FL=1
MAWGKAGSKTGTAGNLVNTTVTSSNIFLTLVYDMSKVYPANTRWTFDSSTGSYYVVKLSTNGGNAGSASGVNFHTHASTSDYNFGIAYISNIPSEQKLAMYFEVSQGNNSGTEQTGSGHRPNRTEGVAKYNPSSLTAIPSIQLKNTDSGSFASGGTLSALGSNMTPAAAVATKVQDGAIFYETDTNKSYVLSSDVWSEL